MDKQSDKGDFMSKWLPNGFLLFVALFLLTYTSLRADLLSLTHDECGSFAIWTNFDIFTCRTDPNCWGTANLHWLYVLLMKMSVKLFGDSELAIRLPALLGHVIYLLFSYRLVKWSTSLVPNYAPFLLVLGFVFLNFNPYLLEFFSLARGYGLAMSLMMASLYYLARWVENGKLGPLLGTLGGAALAVISNFTLLIYFACLLIAIGGIVVWAFFKKDENRAMRLKWASIGSAVYLLLLAWLLYHPIQILREQGEFEWGSPAFYDTYKSLVHCSMYGGRYLKMYNLELFGGLFFLLLLAATGLAVSIFFKKQNDTVARFFLVAVALPLLAALAAVAQHWILGTQYQVNRTAIMFIPLCALAVFLFFQNWLAQSRSPWRLGLAVVVGLFVLVHFGRVSQLSYTSEWGYDAETKHMMAYMAAKIPKGEKVKLGVNWLYHPAASYYQKHFDYNFTEPPVYSKSLFLDGRYDYYYVQPNDVPMLDSLYEEEARFSWSGVLLRKK
ncbi:MAG: hypothetical protein GC192_14505 [Bacteroidetes bacterium]|nr:hypothetical protein [Bacteroidota bacterium]